jgi:hypothetical protein
LAIDKEIYNKERSTEKPSGGNQGIGGVLEELAVGANPGVD